VKNESSSGTVGTRPHVATAVNLLSTDHYCTTDKDRRCRLAVIRSLRLPRTSPCRVCAEP
jgi:hypothetical protein